MNRTRRFLSRLLRSGSSLLPVQIGHRDGRPYPRDESLLKLLAAIHSYAGCEVRELAGIVDMGLEDLKDALAAAAAEGLVNIREAGLTLFTLLRPRAHVYLTPRGQTYLIEHGSQTTYSVRSDIEPDNGGITPPEGIRL